MVKTQTVRSGAIVVEHRRDDFWTKFDQGIWEPATVRVFEVILANGGHFVDIGGWIGPTSLLASTLADKVLVFEPDPVAYGELLRNLDLNPELKSRVTARQAAIYKTAGSMPMRSNSAALGDSGSSLLHPDTRGRKTVLVDVLDARTVTDDEFFNHCSFVKIDVEGAEYAVIPRMGGWLRERRAPILLGLHGYSFFERFGWAPATLAKQLRRATVLTLRTRIAWSLRTHRHWYLPEDSWSVPNDSWARRPDSLRKATLADRVRILTKVREVDVLMSPKPIPEFELP